MRPDVAQKLARARKARDAAQARLTDMEVQEVSLVDQAANLRRFAIVKRTGGDVVVFPCGSTVPTEQVRLMLDACSPPRGRR